MKKVLSVLLFGLLLVTSMITTTIISSADSLPTMPPEGYDKGGKYPAGKVEWNISYYSTVAKRDLKMHVYTPPGYNPSQKYGVIYCYQGIGADADTAFVDWCINANVVCDNLIGEGKIKPVIIVSLDDQFDGNDSDVSGMTIKDAIPYVDSHYSTYADADHRGVYGYSWGGGYAFNVGCQNPDVFHYISPSAAAPNKLPDTTLFPDGGKEAKQKLKCLFISWGGVDYESIVASNRECVNYCTKNSIPHYSWEVPGAGHWANEVWRPAMWNFLQLADKAGISNSSTRSAYEQIEAESYSRHLGIQCEDCSEGGQDVGFIENGDYVVYSNIDFENGAGSFKARVASATEGGNIEIRLDSITGTLVGTCKVTGTGGWQTWTDVTCNVSGAEGKHDLYLKFTGGSGYLFNLNWLKFSKASITPTSTPTSTPTATIGDLNGDGKVNSIDFGLLKQHLLGITKLTGKNLSNADVNGDGNVNSIDFGLMKQYLLGIIKTFPGENIETPKPTPTVTTTPTAAAKFHCFLLLGQSNMAGYAKTQDSDRVEDPRVLVLGYDNNPRLGRVTNEWDIACPPLHPAWLDAIGPGDWFGKTMIQKVPAGDTIGLIPCAISGEKIETFMKSGGSKYDWIINRAKLAQQKGGVIEGIIFHQGESNNGDPNWPGKVATLVEDLRKDLNLGDVPFLPAELPYTGGCAGHNKLVNQLPSLISNCYVVSANGLVIDPDDTYNLHFSHDSTVTLGKRYAEKLIQVLGW